MRKSVLSPSETAGFLNADVAALLFLKKKIANENK